MGERLNNAKSLYLEAILHGDYEQAIHTYSGDRYTQHSTPVEDGQEGFIEFFTEFVKRNPIRDIEIVRSFEDGQYVFLHVVQNLNEGEFMYATADIFDTDDDAKMIEHWDIIAEMIPSTASGRTEVDGPTEVVDLEATEANKDIVRQFVDQVLMSGAFDRAGDFIQPDLAQHNALIADGLDAFTGFAEANSMRYIELHNLIGSGNFVVTLSENEVGGVRQAVMDIYRIDDGLIAEHWDVIEEITPEETWVNSGKF